jgi:photosystem II stability/assembly factor-like uncharacterized protein
MSTRRILLVAILAVVAAVAGTVPGQIAAGQVTLSAPAVIHGTAFQAGVYRVTVVTGKATFTMDKHSQDIPAKVETGERKYDQSAIRFEAAGGQRTITEICLGGTKVRLLFE